MKAKEYWRRVRRVQPERTARRMRKSEPTRGSQHRLPIGFVGIDASLSGTGIAILDETDDAILAGDTVHRLYAWTTKSTVQKRAPEILSWYKPPKGVGNDHRHRLHRVAFLAEWTLQALRRACYRYREIIVGIEQYAHSGRGRGASDIHELVGAVKLWLWQVRIPFRLYAPTSIKLAATGNGQADKGDMKVAAWQKFKVDTTRLSDGGSNVVDALLTADLVRYEHEVRTGKVPLGKCPPAVRRVLSQKTKANPVELTKRPLVVRDDIISAQLVQPVFGDV